MKKLIISSLIISSSLFSQAKALDGEIIFRDAMYGTAIGAVGGLALYAADGGKHFGKKMGFGVLVGLVFGIGVGIYESQTALVEINNGKVYASIPQISFKKINVDKQHTIDTLTEINLIGVKF